MDGEALPSKQQLGSELAQFLRNGLGRSLSGGKDENDVKALSRLCLELADDPDEDWRLRIARVVVEELREFRMERERMAIADMLGVELEGDRHIDEIIEGIRVSDAVAPLELKDGRYVQAGQRFRDPRRPNGYSERYVKDTLRRRWLEMIADALLARAEQHGSTDDLPLRSRKVAEVAAVPSTAVRRASAQQPPILLIGAIGVLLVVLGLVWVAAAATGAIG